MKYLPVLGLSTLLLTACMHRDDEAVQYYRLTADSGITLPLPAHAPNGMIGLGPIHIPDYLNRPQMMVGLTENQFRLDENHRWAEHLDENISLALFKTLPARLGTDRIVRHPWPHRQQIDFQVTIDILEFHVNATGQSHLVAQWNIKHNDQTIVDKRSVYQFPASSIDYDMMVQAQSRCLGKLGQEIADTLLRQMP